MATFTVSEPSFVSGVVGWGWVYQKIQRSTNHKMNRKLKVTCSSSFFCATWTPVRILAFSQWFLKIGHCSLWEFIYWDASFSEMYFCCSDHRVSVRGTADEKWGTEPRLERPAWDQLKNGGRVEQYTQENDDLCGRIEIVANAFIQTQCQLLKITFGHQKLALSNSLAFLPHPGTHRPLCLLCPLAPVRPVTILSYSSFLWVVAASLCPVTMSLIS